MGKLEGADKDISEEIELLNEGFDGEVNSKKSKKTNGTRANEKFFHPRNSLLTDLLATKHGQAVYNFSMALALVNCVHLAARSYFDGSGLDFGQRSIMKAFQNGHVALGIWSAIQCFVLSLYFCFKSWLARRSSVKNLKLYNVCGAGAFMFFYLLALPAYAALAVLSRPLGIAASTGIAMEVVRFVMKMYAFVRSNASKSLDAMPSFKSYLFFLFAPTLIFKEDYPRSPEVRWRFVAQCVAQVTTGALLVAAIVDLYIIPIFEDFGSEPVPTVDFVDRVFSCTMPGLVLAMTVFYCFFHSWMNGFAEVMRFADRAFYSDWWTSTSFREFNRKFNTIVQDWIYFYVYRDLKSIFKRQFNCLLVIGVLTALALEYVLSLGTRMVAPKCGWVLLVQPLLVHWTGSGRCINFIICLCVSLCVMLSLSLYSMEMFARQNRK